MLKIWFCGNSVLLNYLSHSTAKAHNPERETHTLIGAYVMVGVPFTISWLPVILRSWWQAVTKFNLFWPIWHFLFYSRIEVIIEHASHFFFQNYNNKIKIIKYLPVAKRIQIKIRDAQESLCHSNHRDWKKLRPWLI